MKRLYHKLAGIALVVHVALVGQPAAQGVTFRVLSWNVSGESPVKQRASFLAHLRLAEPDIVLLDEVHGSIKAEEFRALLGVDYREWHLLWGDKGGRQRIVIFSRSPLAPIESFQRNTYSDAASKAVLAAAPADRRDEIARMMSFGIPVNAAILRIDGRRLLVAAMDLQCCAAERWEEVRRVEESRAIRKLVDDAIKAEAPEGVIVAGDFNLAAAPAGATGTGALPLVLLSGPYSPPVNGLIAAEAMHKDGQEAWTIHNGEKSRFPALPFDFQLYSPSSLRLVDAYVMDSADYPAGVLERVGLSQAASAEFSIHRPVVATYDWSRQP